MSDALRKLRGGHGTGADFHAVITCVGRWPRWLVLCYTGGNWYTTDSWYCFTHGGAKRSARRWVRKERRKTTWRQEPEIVT